MFRLIIISILSIITINAKSATPIKSPEAIIYDPVSNTYFISNCGSNSILRMDTAGNISDFYPQKLIGINGLFSLGDTLFVTVKHDIVFISIAYDTLIADIPIPGSSYLESVTSDYKGKLYITDSGNGHIYEIDLATRAVRSIYDKLKGPQGILYDFVSKRMIFIDEFSRNIYQLNLEDYTKTPIFYGHTYMDGLTQDNCGNFYVSSWETQSVYVYDNNFKNEKLIASGKGPADISIDGVHNLLLLPELAGHSIKFVKLSEKCSTINHITDSKLNDYNVFISKGVLKMTGLPEYSEYKINIYSIMGLLKLNIDYTKNKDIDLTGFQPGVYIVVLRDNANKNLSCNKIIY
jgi:sugar lactone lactonase YvrE